MTIFFCLSNNKTAKWSSNVQPQHPQIQRDTNPEMSKRMRNTQKRDLSFPFSHCVHFECWPNALCCVGSRPSHQLWQNIIIIIVVGKVEKVQCYSTLWPLFGSGQLSDHLRRCGMPGHSGALWMCDWRCKQFSLPYSFFHKMPISFVNECNARVAHTVRIEINHNFCWLPKWHMAFWIAAYGPIFGAGQSQFFYVLITIIFFFTYERMVSQSKTDFHFFVCLLSFLHVSGGEIRFHEVDIRMQDETFLHSCPKKCVFECSKYEKLGASWGIDAEQKVHGWRSILTGHQMQRTNGDITTCRSCIPRWQDRTTYKEGNCVV